MPVNLDTSDAGFKWRLGRGLLTLGDHRRAYLAIRRPRGPYRVPMPALITAYILLSTGIPIPAISGSMPEAATNNGHVSDTPTTFHANTNVLVTELLLTKRHGRALERSMQERNEKARITTCRYAFIAV